MDIRLSLGIPLHLHPPPREGDASGDSAPGDTEDHGEALQRGRFAIWIAAGVLAVVGIGGFAVAAGPTARATVTR